MGTTSFEHTRCEFGVCHPAGPLSLTPCLRRRPRRSCARSTGCACPSASRCPPERSWAAPRPGCHRTRMPSCEYPGSPRTPSLMVPKDPAARHSSRNRAQHPCPQSHPYTFPKTRGALPRLGIFGESLARVGARGLGRAPPALPALLRAASARSAAEIIESYIRIDNRWKGGRIIGKDKWPGPNITATLILFKDSKLEGALRFLSPNYFR